MGKGKRRVGNRGDRVVVEDPRAGEPIGMPGKLTSTGGESQARNRYEMRNKAGEVLLKLEVVCPVCTVLLCEADAAEAFRLEGEAYERMRAKHDKREIGRALDKQDKRDKQDKAKRGAR